MATNSETLRLMTAFTTKLVVAAINHVLLKESWARSKLLPFAGQSALIEAVSLQIEICIKPDGLFEVVHDIDQLPSVSITLPDDVVAKTVTGNFAAVFTSSRISGSAELAEALAFVFRNIQWDPEADLAAILGDIPASRIISGFKSLLDWQKSLSNNLVQNIKEFVVEESLQVVGLNEILEFGNSVNTLRDDLARLDKRILRL